MAKASIVRRTVTITPKGTMKCPLCKVGNVPSSWYSRPKKTGSKKSSK